MAKSKPFEGRFSASLQARDSAGEIVAFSVTATAGVPAMFQVGMTTYDGLDLRTLANMLLAAAEHADAGEDD